MNRIATACDLEALFLQIAHNIKKERQDRCMTIRQLAYCSGLSVQTIVNAEKGTTAISLPVIVAIFRAMKIRVYLKYIDENEL